MKVVVCEAPRTISIQETPVPAIKNDHVLVKLNYCGICVYDLKRYLGLKDISYPIILGHEPSGVVEKTGKNVQNIQEGDRVAVDVKVKCGKCPACVRGMESRCFSAEASSGFSQYMLVPQQNVTKISPGLDLRVATLTEPLACILHGYSKLNLKNQQSLLVVGDGIMGVLAGFVGKVLQKKKVTLSGHTEQRMVIAHSFGVECVSPQKNSLASLHSYDTIILTVEEKDIINNLNKFLHPGGHLLFIGELNKGDYHLNLNTVYTSEYIFAGSKGYNGDDFKNAVGFIQRFQDTIEQFITRTYTIDELEAGFEDMLARKILKGVLCLNS
jgi:L-iditol 2-dehydrogenase